MLSNVKNYNLLTSMIICGLISSCTNHSPISKSDENGESVCRLSNSPAKLINSNYASIDLKRNGRNDLAMRISFHPRNPHEDPIKNPGIIIRTYKNNDINFDKKINSSESIFSSDTQKITEKDFLSYRYNRYLLNLRSFPFDLDKDIFERILLADKTEILIQTHYEPIIVVINEEDKALLAEFKKECLPK